MKADGGAPKGKVQLCLFARAPVRGRVKTRMQTQLDEAQVLDLHLDLLQACLTQLRESEAADLVLSASEPHPRLSELADLHGVALELQHGRDLGERMRHAIRNGLQDHRAVILVGADCPFVNADYIEQAAAALDAAVPVVFGPAEDGGYVLLGATRDIPKLFDGVTWGSDQVLARSRQNLSELGLSWRELPVLPDIDHPSDLKKLAGHRMLSQWAQRASGLS